MSSLSKFKGSGLFNTGSRSFTGLLDVDRVKANPIYKCFIAKKIAVGNPVNYIQGVYNSDSQFSVSVGSEYVDQFELPEDAQNALTKLQGGMNWMRNMQEKSQFIVKSIRMSEQRWNGSTAPTFSVKIDIPIVRRADAPWEAIKYCLRATCGTLQEGGAGGQVQRMESAWQIFAPNGYKINYSDSANSHDTPEGTYTIALGEGRKCWFRMTDAVITNMDVSIGNKKYYDGNPTSVSIVVQFKFWRYPLYEDIITWFPLMRQV